MQDFRDVLAFHQRFDLPCGDMPRPMTPDKVQFRVPFLVEECDEFQAAWNEKNLVQAADALFDLAYVAIGTALFIGAPRYGSLGYWAPFSEIAMTAQGLAFIPPNIPRLLNIGMHMHFAATLKSRIELFKLSHDAAVNGEINALPASLHNLKQLVYACYTTAFIMGVPWEKCWRHVQNANMAKERAKHDGSDSKRGTPWDVVKPKGWRAPDVLIARELMDSGWKAPDWMRFDEHSGKVYEEGSGITH